MRAAASRDAAVTTWERGYGVIRHQAETRERIAEMVARIPRAGDGAPAYALLAALDRLTCAAMWLVVHQTYARNVYLDGRPLAPGDFKARPEGHTGGALNMVPAYAGYLAANALSGITRGWLMGQGHCVAAIDAVNVLTGNTTPAHAARYAVSDDGLTRYVRDFYAYRLGDDGRLSSPLGSHVNAHTAGGLAEGGYLGFAELQWVHMPLPGERLVAFLSDGAFEEQRGGDWAPRWWRADDSGLVTPIMIKNGRRIDQRTTMSQQGGVSWLVRHLRLNAFDPIVFDGRDPAAFTWAIIESERRLETLAQEVASGRRGYPVPLPYGIAVAPKGYGFPGAGTNFAHNLPLVDNPRIDGTAALRFNGGARRLWVAPEELRPALETFAQHATSGRPRERDHPLVDREVALASMPVPVFRPVGDDLRRDPAKWSRTSPMAAVDWMFASLVSANPHLRPRVGNPDEMRSNRLLQTLELLKFRVTDPELTVPESVHGAVITALNEEAVASAALANKGGLNLIHTYEAFGAKMHGAVRQEITFANHCAEAGRPQRWLSVPLILTSHTWENAKNEQSHQDPSMAESMMGELSPVARVVFPVDFNTAAAVMADVYQTHGQIWTIVVPKGEVPELLSSDEARRATVDGGVHLEWAGFRPETSELVLVAIGAYQLEQVLLAARRLGERSIAHRVVVLLEPGRFRRARTAAEARHQAPPEIRAQLFPERCRTVVLASHTRPEPMLGVLEPLRGRWVGALGYTGIGGTHDTAGLLFVNGASWAHMLAETVHLLGMPREHVLDASEIDALEGRRSPHGIIVPAIPEDA